MQINSIQPGNSNDASSGKSIPKYLLYKVILKNAVWLLGILPWLFGAIDLGYDLLAPGMTTPTSITQFFTVIVLFGGWLYLKPDSSVRSDQGVAFQGQNVSPSLHQADHLSRLDARMMELQPYHLIGREYVLPFPYLCQIYHLLNLKHLETIHSFSLSNLKVLGVEDFQPTATGGTLRFQTMLDSPFNILRLWRQDTVEVELTLHTPFTVELQVPVRDEKTINVIFNVLPLGQAEHRLYVDIYSNLSWPKPMLRFLLELATSLTLLEDLPYLRLLTAREQVNRIPSKRQANSAQEINDSMQLYYRYVRLYRSTLDEATNPQSTPESSSYQFDKG